jgi:hypothetical protein
MHLRIKAFYGTSENAVKTDNVATIYTIANTGTLLI